MTCAIDKIAVAFANAERAIKQNERLTLSVPLPAINQLRYAAYHLVKISQCSQDDKDRTYHIERALAHCERAHFDALDGIIYSCLDFITAFQKLCRSRLRLETVYPDYRSDYDFMADCQEQFATLRIVQEMGADDLAEMENLASRFVAFKRKILRMKVKVEALECKIADEESIVVSQQFLIPFVATVLGTLIGMVGLLLTIWSMLPDSFVWKCLIIGIVASSVFLGIFKFYGWAVRHMLSPMQRKVFESKYGFDFGDAGDGCKGKAEE